MNSSLNNNRGYQPDFFTLSESVRDPEKRHRKADKIRWVLTEVGPHPLHSMTCLDVGCSSGLMTGVFAPLFARTIGLDYDAVALDTVDAHVQLAVDFLRGDAMQLPIPDASIDVIVCAQVYEHVPDAQRLFAEIYRVLKPGGAVVFSGPNWLFPIEPHYFLPFLHWLPSTYANRTLQWTGQGQAYYERSADWWRLRWWLRQFEIEDLTPALMRTDYLVTNPRLSTLTARVPLPFWRWLGPLLPNFNWLLRKPRN
jgi:SAM-dependent methyltransferase